MILKIFVFEKGVSVVINCVDRVRIINVVWKLRYERCLWYCSNVYYDWN